jgi:hypothetical protein
MHSAASASVMPLQNRRSAPGETEEVIFRNGQEFADYTKRIDVPGSRYVSDLVADGQIRLFTFEPKAQP